MTGQVKLLLVDDHALIRETLADRLNREPDLLVVAVVGEAEAALQACCDHHPDLVLMDINMPGLSCFDASRRLRSVRPQVKIIFLSAFTHDLYIDQALKVKAHGYLTKREPVLRVIAAIREVASGGAYFSEEVRSRIVVDSSGTKLRQQERSIASTLTSRELDVLIYIAKGMSLKEIARQMNRSEKTVSAHTARLMEKSNIHDRLELAKFAIREGLAEP